MSAVELKRFTLFEELSEEEREVLSEEIERIELEPGDVLFREHEEASGLVLLVEGRVRLESQRAGELGSVGPGSALGAVSLVTVGPREASAIAESACSIFLLRRSTFRRLADDAPRAACRLAEAIARETAAFLRAGLEPLVRSAVDRAQTEP
ncbi:MAG TPA: cyclic nucleotide-binding domain-containing protein [Myxococcota bacterium]|nr:cyclic nucleotide-binding domain-containing protein [Myxococcota bacterium]